LIGHTIAKLFTKNRSFAIGLGITFVSLYIFTLSVASMDFGLLFLLPPHETGVQRKHIVDSKTYESVRSFIKSVVGTVVSFPLMLSDNGVIKFV
jgi:hypothetical protein